MSRTEAAVAGGTRRKTLALAVPPAGLAASLFLPPVLAGLPIAGQRALIVTLITILLWTGEILEPGVAALVGVTLLALSGATGSLRDALQGFANPVPFFLIGVLTMGVAVVRSGLAERLARTILERPPGKSLAVYLQLVLSFPILTFVLPSATTRSGILIHIYDEVFSLGASSPTEARRSGSGTRRSEEHTSELQSLRHLVFRLLLEKKKKTPPQNIAADLPVSDRQPSIAGTTEAQRLL